MSDERLTRLRALLHREGLEAMLISNPENCSYVSGFTGEGHILVSSGSAMVITDSRYYEQAGIESLAFELVKSTGPFHETLPGAVEKAGIRTLAFEDEHTTYREFTEISRTLEAVDCRTVPVRGIVEKMREIKSPGEVESIRRACDITVRALNKVLPRIRPGVLEREVALELEIEARRAGAAGMAFPTIVAAGRRGSLPHAKPGDNRIESGDIVTIDFGAMAGLYCADMTRTFAVGKPPPVLARVYEVVREAQETAVRGIRPGMSLREADALARNVIERAGYGGYFGHGLGHGVGLAVHEGPRLSPKAPADGVIREGMVITVEPGVYLPGAGGVRIEDTVWVREDGVEVLTGFPKGLVTL